jgi:hypothetical protein
MSKIQTISELLRIAHDKIMGKNFDSDKDIQIFNDTVFRRSHRQTFPNCYLTMRKNDGSLFPYFPLCNSSGVIDVRMIDHSIKITEKILEDNNNETVDYNHIKKTIKRLKFLKQKYSKKIPKPSDMAYKKSLATKMIKNAKEYKDKIYGNGENN